MKVTFFKYINIYINTFLVLAYKNLFNFKNKAFLSCAVDLQTSHNHAVDKMQSCHYAQLVLKNKHFQQIIVFFYQMCKSSVKIYTFISHMSKKMTSSFNIVYFFAENCWQQVLEWRFFMDNQSLWKNKP